MSSLRERLAAKQRGTARYRLAVEDPWPAERRLTDAENTLAAARMLHPDEPGHEKVLAAEQAVGEAKAERDGCYEWITLRAMPAGDFEALIGLHPPTPEQKEKNPDAQWNEATLAAPLLAACIEGDMTESDWKEFLAKTSEGEHSSLLLSAIGVNLRIPDPNLPKG